MNRNHRPSPVHPASIIITKITPTAEIPFKEEQEHVASEIILTGRTNGRIEDSVNEINEYETGLVIQPNAGVYGMVFGSSDLLQKGYILTPFVLEPTSDAPVVIPLYKFKECSDLELPSRGVKLLFFPIIEPAMIPNNPKAVVSSTSQSSQTGSVMYNNVPIPHPQTKTVKKTIRSHMS